MATKDKTVYMTAGAKKHLLNHSEELHRALNRFLSGDFGSSSQDFAKPRNELIKDFGAYDLGFGVIWIISYHLFTNRDFITLLLPCEYGEELQNPQVV